ncbi:MAG: hypothetical protein WD069_06735 [Planctomycetales bacterium]
MPGAVGGGGTAGCANNSAAIAPHIAIPAEIVIAALVADRVEFMERLAEKWLRKADLGAQPLMVWSNKNANRVPADVGKIRNRNASHGLHKMPSSNDLCLGNVRRTNAGGDAALTVPHASWSPRNRAGRVFSPMLARNFADNDEYSDPSGSCAPPNGPK